MSQVIDFRGSLQTEDDLRETLWLVTMELNAGLPKGEQIQARRQIAELEAALAKHT
ncbi:hypothetical protein [Rhodospirillum sp. A1_3_36]|uniref:hypothetical protein n=1 Tax=Rhodospirillum sp. A1_3_36 TaxID=3391666 RepID=UPI0039A689DA